MDRDPHRVVLVALRDLRDRAGNRRREQRRLPRGRGRGEDRLEVLREAHVQHLVRFVEHDDRHAGELQAAAGQVIDRAPRRRDDDVHTAPKLTQLHADRLAAVDRQHAGADALAVSMDRLGHLHRELARGHEDESRHLAIGAGRVKADIGRAACCAGERQAMQRRERERGGLAGAGRRFGEQVAAFHQRRDRLALDRRRFLVPEVGERGQQPRIEPE